MSILFLFLGFSFLFLVTHGGKGHTVIVVTHSLVKRNIKRFFKDVYESMSLSL